MFERSNRGQRPTPFERELIAAGKPTEPDDQVSRWLLLAQRGGIEAVLSVLDEFGGERVKVISRRKLFDSLERPLADEIIAARAAAGQSVCEIAAELEIHRRRVYRSLCRSGAAAHMPDEVNAPR